MWLGPSFGHLGPTLEGLTDGDQVYLVQEFAGEELQKIIDGGGTVAPDLAFKYLEQIATGADLCLRSSRWIIFAHRMAST